MGLDEFADELERFELEGATKLTPREYGKLRGMAPQMVYYYIRIGVVDVERCQCGRRVIDVDLTDKAISTRQEARRKSLASGESVPPREGPMVS
jgi:hypothetical protein